MIEPIVFVPGMMSDARLFAPQINDLSRDFPIHVANFRGRETIRTMAQAVLDAAPDRFALAGVSMGGIIAMEMLRHAPERIGRIALVSTTPLAETPAQAAWREPQIVKARAGFLAEALDEIMPLENLAPGPNRQVILRQLKEMGLDLGSDEFVRQARALQRRRDAQNVLLGTKASALVLCGAHDRLTPVKRHETMAELIAHSELVILPDAGHLPNLEQPEETNAALRDWMARPLMLR